MPRRNRGAPKPGKAQFPHEAAKGIIKNAPYPSHNRATGRRPHAHYDTEERFTKEKIGLQPLDGVAKPKNKDAPVLWAYPAEDFDYAAQNRFGRVGSDGGKAPGPHRIITDRNKNIKGMTTHPYYNPHAMVRAPHRVDYYRVRSDRVRK